MIKKNSDATSSYKTLKLFTLLFFSGRRHFLTELAEILECSKATVLRLVRTIESTGVAYIDTGMEDRKRWFQFAAPLSAGTPRITLDASEVEKLALCRDILRQLLPGSMERILSDAVDKISLFMDKVEERGKITAPKALRMTRGHIDYTPFQPFIDCLMKAVPDHTVCAVTYKAPLKVERVFEIVPVRLMVDGDVLNVEGWRVTDHGRPQIRFPMTLAVQRIKACAATRRRLEKRPPLPELEGAFGIVGDEPFRVRALFNEEFGAQIRERVWSKDQALTDTPDGGVELVFTATSKEQVLYWILGFGSGAELLEPADVRAMLREQAESLRDIYG